jgi:hypothetical protein
MSTALAPGAVVETAIRFPVGRPAQHVSANARTAIADNPKFLFNRRPRSLADSDEAARVKRDDAARGYDMMPPTVTE